MAAKHVQFGAVSHWHHHFGLGPLRCHHGIPEVGHVYMRRIAVRCGVKTPFGHVDVTKSEGSSGIGFGQRAELVNGEETGDEVVMESLLESDDEDDSMDESDGKALQPGSKTPLDLIDGEEGDITLKRIQSTFPYELDRFQKQAISHILGGKSVMVCAPTGAGKTAIAEAAAILCLNAGNRVVYTTPLKALSNQKVLEFQERFGPERVGLITGDVSMQPDAPIVVMTTEILRNIMYSVGERSTYQLEQTGIVVLDEVHYLSDPSRGSVWEEIIAACPKHIRMLCMSATVANPADLGSWISTIHGPCKTVQTMERPVPLQWHFASGDRSRVRITDLFNEGSSGEMHDSIRWSLSRYKDTSQKVPKIPALTEALDKDDFLPAIVFTFSRKMCDAYAMLLNKAGFQLTSRFESDKIKEAIKKLKSEQPQAVRNKLVKALAAGIASHHAGCLPGWKVLVEKLFQEGYIKIVFATETLAAGINMPARTTVITSTSKVGGQFSRQPLMHNQLLQMAGRAGRRGYDTIGNCIICQSMFDKPQDSVRVINQGPEPLVSQFKSGYSLVLNLLSQYTLPEAEKFCNRSFRNYMAQRELTSHQKKVNSIEEEAGPLVEELNRVTSKDGGRASATEIIQRLESQLEELSSDLQDAVHERRETIRPFLSPDKLPVVVELNKICNLSPGESAITMPAIVFDVEEDVLKGKEWIVCLGMDNHLYRVGIQGICAVYQNKIESSPELKQLCNQKDGLVSIKRWKKHGSGWHVEGKLWTAKLVREHLRRMKDQGCLEQIPECSDHLSRVEECAQEYDELLRRRAVLVKRTKDIRFKNKIAASRRLKMAKKQLNRAKNKLDRLSSLKNVNWEEFQRAMAILQKAGALDAETNAILPLGQIARELRGENELWLAMAVTHPATALLDKAALAGFISSLIAYECVSRPEIIASQPPMQEVYEIMGELDTTLADLMSWEMEFGFQSEVEVDLRLSGMVAAWVHGCDWEEIMEGTSLEDGDVARLFTRTMDVLQQITACRNLMKPLRSTAKEAYKEMNRTPIKEAYG